MFECLSIVVFVPERFLFRNGRPPITRADMDLLKELGEANLELYVDEYQSQFKAVTGRKISQTKLSPFGVRSFTKKLTVLLFFC
jgi:hypothetical protein